MLRLLVALLMLIPGCNRPAAVATELPAASAPDPGRDAGEAAARRCAADADCESGFCDVGSCAAPGDTYGLACQVAPRTATGERDGKLSVCGAYVCSDGRCRSCRSDQECQSELGAPRCYQHEVRPGMRCGNPL